MNYKELREGLGLTQLEVSKKVGVSRMSYRNWEDGSCNPTDDNLQKLKKVLEVV